MTKQVYIWGVGILACSVIGFYYLQNLYPATGGSISFMKASWLGMTIFYWLFLPVLILHDSRTIHKMRMVYLIFFINILARVLIELYLMYVEGAWKYEYGIAHNIFSFLLLVGLFGTITKQQKQLVLKNTLKIIVGIFVAETYFAFYMAQYMCSGEGGDAVWFVPWATEHLLNNTITSIVVLLLAAWQIHFYRVWIKQ